jgi:hypothetical protein
VDGAPAARGRGAEFLCAGVHADWNHITPPFLLSQSTIQARFARCVSVRPLRPDLRQLRADGALLGRAGARRQRRFDGYVPPRGVHQRHHVG